MSAPASPIPADQRTAPPHGVAVEMPRAVKRETAALRLDGCHAVHVSMFDREAGVWAITFTRGGERKATLIWTVEVDV